MMMIGREQVYLIVLISMAAGHMYFALPGIYGGNCSCDLSPIGRNTSQHVMVDSDPARITPPSTTSPQFRAAAMMLVSKPWSEERAGRNCHFNASIEALQEFWYPANPYPIVLQHPDGWTNQEMEEIRAKWPALQFRFSSSHRRFNEVDIPSKPEDNNELSPVGYKKMISYKTFGFLRDDAAADLDYVMHIDDDTCFLESVPYDVFQTMHEHKLVYAFKQIFRDAPDVVKELPKFADTFLQRRNLTYANPKLYSFLKGKRHVKWQRGLLSFSTNLEWIDLNEFRRNNLIVEFHSALEYSGMIFHRRWGDAPIRFLFAYMFWNRHQVLEVCAEYLHSAWRKAESTCDANASTATPLIKDSVMKAIKRCGDCWVASA